MSNILSIQRIYTAVSHNVAGFANAPFEIKDEILMYGEIPTVKWVGPYVVHIIDGKFVSSDRRDRILMASIDEV